MSDVVKKVCDHMPEGFFWHHIFLAAFLTIMPLHNGPAIQAILFFSLRNMGHLNFCLKISTKKYKKAIVLRYALYVPNPRIRS